MYAPMRLMVMAAAATVLMACGPRKPGPEAEQIYFWHVRASTLEFGQCSDDPEFRKDINPLEFGDNSYIVFKVAKDVQTAKQQTCESLSASTCTDTQGGIVFDIAGTELTFSREFKDPIGMTGCSLQQNENWTFRDEGLAFSLDIANVLTLTDATTACDNVDANLKLKSPNMQGVSGCVITWKLTGDLR